jgi:hypothetical protein
MLQAPTGWLFGMMKTTMSRREWLQPLFLVVPFTTIVSGLFNFSDYLPVPLAVLAGAAWGGLLCLIAAWISRNRVLAAWVEDALVVLGATAVAFAACGGLMAILMLGGVLNSPSLTGETLLELFLPTIPYYIVTNAALELLIIPGLLLLGWRAGRRRILIVTAAALFFALRVWTYLAFVPARLGFAESGQAAVPLTAVERQQAYDQLMVDDPRWMLLLVIFGVLLLAAHLPRLRESGQR